MAPHTQSSAENGPVGRAAGAGSARREHVSAIRAAGLLAAVAAAWTVCAPTAEGQRLVLRGAVAQRVAAGINAPGAAATDPAITLIKTDEELISYLKEAQRLVENKAYPQAIEILQAMILRPDSGFVPGDGGVYVGLGIKANEILRKMGPEGLKLYRAAYEGQAQVLFEKALVTGQAGLLHQVAEQYLNTSFGARALDELGAAYYDRGRFAQAAYCWKQVSAMRPEWTSQPMLLAKVAVACQLAGESAEARRILETLKKEFPAAEESLAGRARNVAAFVEGVLGAAGAASSEKGMVARNWPGLGGVPDGLAVMPDCRVVLAPGWVQRAGESDTAGSNVSLIASDALGRFQFARRMQTVVKLRLGQAIMEARQANRVAGQFKLAGTIHPVICGQTMIYRTDDKIIARDITTGRLNWEAGNLPVVREVSLPGSDYYSEYYPQAVEEGTIGDVGRYMVTAADLPAPGGQAGGKIFFRHGFLPTTMNLAAMRARLGADPTMAERLADNSSLSAMAIGSGAQGGKLLWRVGQGQGDDKILREGKFVSPATYCLGRLYVIVLHVERYFVVCLDADSGRTIWRTAVCQPPAVQSGYYGMMVSQLFDRCSPPAVSDGRVFALPNVGVLVALEAETGQPLWAHPYKSQFGPQGWSYSDRVVMNGAAPEAVNPVIVSGSRVVCLPSDSSSVLALKAEDGSQLWSADRARCADLSAIDAGRVLLSGPGLVVLSADGKELHRASETDDVLGRPAVTDGAVLAAGAGRLYRLDLKTYKLSAMDLADSRGLLGNLVSSGDALIAANPAGLCAYFPFDVARATLDKEIATAEPAGRAKLLFRRGQLAFHAGAPQDALKDLLECGDLAARQNDSETAAQLRTWIYRAYVAVGNSASEPGRMREYFEKALALAATDQERAHMKLRLAKACEKAGDLAAAASIAQEISDTYAAEDLADVSIGPQADTTVRFGAGDQAHGGKELAQGFIRRLIESHGRGLYAAFDRLAHEALTRARDAQDPQAMQAVFDRWPGSDAADDALYAAAGLYAAMARNAKDDQAGALMQKARADLAVVAGMTDSPLHLPAGAVMAALCARDGKIVAAGEWCDKVRSARDYDPAAPVDFGDIRGSVGSVLEQVERQSAPRALARGLPAQDAFIAPPTAEQFTIAGQTAAVRLLCDQEYRPVRLGEKLLAVQGGRAILVDASAKDAGSAVVWSALTPVDAQQLAMAGSGGTWAVASLSANGKMIAIAGRQEVRGFDVETASIRWARKMSELDLGEVAFLSAGQDVVVAADQTGKLAWVDIATGQVVGKAFVRGGDRRLSVSAPPQIACGMILVSHGGDSTLTCFDLATARVVGRWRSGRGLAQGWVTGDGLLAMIVDGELSVREIHNGAKARLPGTAGGQGAASVTEPIWRRPLSADGKASLLGVSDEFVAVCPDRDTGRVEVYSLTGGDRPAAEFVVAGIGGAPAGPLRATFDGQDLYVVCSVRQAGPDRIRLGRLMLVASTGLSLQKFSLSSGLPVWQRDLGAIRGGQFAFTAPTMGRNNVAMSVTTILNFNQRFSSRLFVLDAATGRDVQTVEQDTRTGIPGPAAMTSGRLCVQTSEGLKVYVGKQD